MYGNSGIHWGVYPCRSSRDRALVALIAFVERYGSRCHRILCSKSRQEELDFLIELAALSEMGWCVVWGDMSHDTVNVAMKQNVLKGFGEVISFVNCRVDAFEDQKVTFHPLTKYVVTDVHVPRPASGLLGVGHSGTCIIVFVKSASGLLRNIEVPEDAVDI